MRISINCSFLIFEITKNACSFHCNLTEVIGIEPITNLLSAEVKNSRVISMEISVFGQFFD